LIMEIVGTPQLDDMKYACEAARKYILRQAPRKPDEQILHCLASPNFCSQDAVQLLRRLLVFNPEKRLTASKALQNSYIRQGRDCYHSTICSCHPPRPFHSRKQLASMSDDLSSCFPDSSNEFEPVIQFPFSFQLHKRLEEDLESPPPLTTIRTELYRLCLESQKDSNNPLRVNTKSPAYRQFIEDQPQMKN
jgi:nemo like kinase